MLRPAGAPWPPPELIQKLYESKHLSAFTPGEEVLTKTFGFYSDLQSLHSEDAITWSVFGPIAYASPEQRKFFVRAFLELLEIPTKPISTANVWLWRRLPHPDNLVSGGPEIDFGVQTDDVFLLGEAKWMSKIGVGQGVGHDKDQIVLRREFCSKYGRRILPTCRRFVVTAIGIDSGSLLSEDTRG